MSEQNKKEMPELPGEDSFEPAAIETMNLDTSEPMPARLRRKIAADAGKYFASQRKTDAGARLEPKKSLFHRLGWAVAAMACVILAFNIYTTRINPAAVEIKLPPKIELSPAQERERFLASAQDIVRSNWSDFNPNEPKNIQGDVVWSSAAQKGFIRLRNLPVNDKTKEQYQLWIFDESQQYPVDGGVFDSDAAGEIVIPINAKIKVQKPLMFAVTAEKAGGVVVSAREKVMAIAKVAA